MEKTKTSGKVTFQDKSVYIGELENEIPNGYGVLTHPNGEEYKGQWADGKRKWFRNLFLSKWRTILRQFC